MLIIPSITETNLKEIGIKKTGHRMKIMLFINEMKNNNNKAPYKVNKRPKDDMSDADDAGMYVCN